MASTKRTKAAKKSVFIARRGLIKDPKSFYVMDTYGTQGERGSYGKTDLPKGDYEFLAYCKTAEVDNTEILKELVGSEGISPVVMESLSKGRETRVNVVIRRCSVDRGQGNYLDAEKTTFASLMLSLNASNGSVVCISSFDKENTMGEAKEYEVGTDSADFYIGCESPMQDPDYILSIGTGGDGLIGNVTEVSLKRDFFGISASESNDAFFGIGIELVFDGNILSAENAMEYLIDSLKVRNVTPLLGVAQRHRTATEGLALGVKTFQEGIDMVEQAGKTKLVSSASAASLVEGYFQSGPRYMVVTTQTALEHYVSQGWVLIIKWVDGVRVFEKMTSN